MLAQLPLEFVHCAVLVWKVRPHDRGRECGVVGRVGKALGLEAQGSVLRTRVPRVRLVRDARLPPAPGAWCVGARTWSCGASDASFERKLPVYSCTPGCVVDTTMRRPDAGSANSAMTRSACC